MLATETVIFASLCYIGAHCSVSPTTETNAPTSGSSIISNPYIYALVTGRVLYGLDLLWQRWPGGLGRPRLSHHLSGAHPHGHPGLAGTQKSRSDLENPPDYLHCRFHRLTLREKHDAGRCGHRHRRAGHYSLHIAAAQSDLFQFPADSSISIVGTPGQLPGRISGSGAIPPST